MTVVLLLHPKINCMAIPPVDLVNSFRATFQLYRGGQFYWWRKPEDLEKTIDLSQVTDKLYYLALIEIRTHISGDRH